METILWLVVGPPGRLPPPRSDPTVRSWTPGPRGRRSPRAQGELCVARRGRWLLSRPSVEHSRDAGSDREEVRHSSAAPHLLHLLHPPRALVSLPRFQPGPFCVYLGLDAVAPATDESVSRSF